MADLTMLDLDAGPPPLFHPTATKPAVYTRRRSFQDPLRRMMSAASSSEADLSRPESVSTMTTRRRRKRRSSLGSIAELGDIRNRSRVVGGDDDERIVDDDDQRRSAPPIQNPAFLVVPAPRAPRQRARSNTSHPAIIIPAVNESSASHPPRPLSAPPVPSRFAQSYLPHPATRAPVRELRRPAPPLLRPTTFWRKTLRSGVTAPAYSPSCHLIRRSTFVAAGLEFNRPQHDLSAFGVEERVGFVVLAPEFNLQ